MYLKRPGVRRANAFPAGHAHVHGPLPKMVVRMSSPRRLLLSFLAVALVAVPAPPAAAQEPDPDAPITDPIPHNPVPANLGLTLRDFAAFPKSDPVPAPTEPRLM